MSGGSEMGVKIGCVSGVEGGSKVEWLILVCFGVLVTDRRTDGRTDICSCRVAFATEKKQQNIWKFPYVG